MAPTRLQRFFADDWPGLLAIWSWTIAFVGLIVAALLPGFRFDLRGSSISRSSSSFPSCLRP